MIFPIHCHMIFITCGWCKRENCVTYLPTYIHTNLHTYIHTNITTKCVGTKRERNTKSRWVGMDKIEGENVKIIWTVRTYSFWGQFIEPIPTSHDLSESCNSVWVLYVGVWVFNTLCVICYSMHTVCILCYKLYCFVSDAI